MTANTSKHHAATLNQAASIRSVVNVRQVKYTAVTVHAATNNERRCWVSAREKDALRISALATTTAVIPSAPSKPDHPIWGSNVETRGLHASASLVAAG